MHGCYMTHCPTQRDLEPQVYSLNPKSMLTKVLKVCGRRFGQVPMLLVCVVLSYALIQVTISVLQFAPLNVDAGSYLPLIERLNNGSVLYRDVATSYPPLVFSVVSFIGRRMFQQGEYLGYIALAWTSIALSGLLASGIVYQSTSDKTLSILTALLVPLASLQYEGAGFLLEPFVALLATLSFILACWCRAGFITYCLSGCVVGLAFMSKQYGLGVLPSICVLAWSANENGRFRNVAFVLLGFVLSSGFTLIYVVLSSGVPLVELLARLFPTYTSPLVLPHLDLNFKLSLMILLPFILTAGVLLKDPGFRTDRIVIALLVAVAGFLPQFYFRLYKHYMLLPLPFVIALWGIEFHYILKRKQGSLTSPKVGPVIFTACSLVFMLYSYAIGMSLAGFFNTNKPRWLQIATGVQINEVVPKAARVVLLADPVYYFLCEFRSPQDRITGYGFLENYSAPVIADVIDNAEWVLLSPDDSYFFARPVSILEKAGIDVFELLRKRSFRRVRTSQDDIQIWKKLR